MRKAVNSIAEALEKENRLMIRISASHDKGCCKEAESTLYNCV